MGDELHGKTVTAIASPCVNICKLDPAEKLCVGCFRTLPEVAGWSGMTSAARQMVMADLPARRHRYHIVGSHITISGT